MTGANNEPTITITNDDLPTLSNLGAGQFVADLTATDDVDTSVTFLLQQREQTTMRHCNRR